MTDDLRDMDFFTKDVFLTDKWGFKEVKDARKTCLRGDDLRAGIAVPPEYKQELWNRRELIIPDKFYNFNYYTALFIYLDTVGMRNKIGDICDE